MKILLVAPAAESVRVTAARPAIRRPLFRFSVLPLTVVAAQGLSISVM